MCVCVCVCVFSCLTQYREGYPKQEHSHASQHWYEEVTGQKNGQQGDCWVVSAETPNGSLILSSPDKAHEEQSDHDRPNKQLEGLEIPERNQTLSDT